MSRPTQVLPGDILGPVDMYASGPGTHIHDKHIVASVRGIPRTDPTQTTPSASESPQPPILSVHPSRGRARPVLPAVGGIVYARISAVQRQQAMCSILALETGPDSPAVSPDDSSLDSAVEAAAHPFRGILRAQDVRATEKDRVVVGAAVRVGDVVRAVVASIGDQGGYFLSTAGNELGVVLAWSEGGNLCVPVSWCEVLDEVTGLREERKVAKPV